MASGTDSSSPRETSSSDRVRLMVGMVEVSEEDIATSATASVPVVAPKAAGSTPGSGVTGVVIALESEAAGIAIRVLLSR